MAAEVAAAAVAVAAVATAEVETRAGAPALVEAREQALLIAALRGLLAVAGAGAAVARGVDFGPALGLVAFGAAIVLLSVYGGGRPARSRAKSRIQSRHRGCADARRLARLAEARPSTIGLTALTAIALVLQPPLAAFLAGILAGLAAMSVVGFTRLTVLERKRQARILVDYKGSRVFEKPR